MKIKVLSLTTDKGFGGAEKVFNKVNNSLLKYFEVHECFFNVEAKQFYKSNCIEHNLNVKGSNSVFSKISRFFKRIIGFRKLIRDLQPDIIISHLEGADYVSLLTFTKVKKICVIHGSKVHDKNIRGTKGLLRKKILIPYLYRLSDKIVTVSKGIEEELNEYYKIKKDLTKTIYNFVDYKHISTISSIQIESDYKHIFTNKVLITCCRLSPEKNLENLIRVYQRIKSEKIKLVIIGDGNEKTNLIDFLNTTNLAYKTVWEKNLHEKADVYFLGYQSNPFKYIRLSNLYMLTSYNEGFPLGPIEAMACGINVISSNCPTGPNEILLGKELTRATEIYNKSYAGALMPIPKDEKSIELWTNTIKEILNNKENIQNKFIKNGNKRLEDLTPEFINQQWNILIKELVEK